MLHAAAETQGRKKGRKNCRAQAMPTAPCVQWRNQWARMAAQVRTGLAVIQSFPMGVVLWKPVEPRPERIQNFELCFPEWIKALKS